MNKLQSTRLDDRLNAVLIAIATATLLVLTVDAARDDHAQSVAAAQQVKTAPVPAATELVTAMASAH